MKRPQRFRKKPVVIEAIRYDPHQNCAEIAAFLGVGLDPTCCDSDGWTIDTLEGPLDAQPGDWIIRGVKGEFYPCKPDIFDASYEPVDDEAAP